MANVKTWGERLFYEEELHGRKGRKPKEHNFGKGRNSGWQAGNKGGGKSASYYRDRLTALVEKHPQVNVKITGSNSNLGGFAAHVSYISHNGKEELENEDGEIITGRLSEEELQKMWGGDLSTEETGKSKYKENFHIVFSMPPETDRTKFGIAARETVYELFSGYRFLMAEHSNTAHPHLHVVVKAVGEDGRRLNPKKADLRHWRETFAATLRRHGIKAEATSRQVRGRFEKGLPSVIAQIKRAGRTPDKQAAFEERVAADVEHGVPYNHSKAVQKAKSTRAVVRGIYKAMIHDLSRSDIIADRNLAVKLQNYLDEMPRINPREKVVYQEHRERLEQAKALQKQLARQKTEQKPVTTETRQKEKAAQQQTDGIKAGVKRKR